jgi:hypothetical protein
MGLQTEWVAGGIRTRVFEQPHEGLTYVERSTANETAILQANAELQKLDQRKMDWGRMVASIPELDFANLMREHPELRSRDRNVRGRAMNKILRAHPEWLVVPKARL